MELELSSQHNIFFYDGTCLFCSRFIRFLHYLDRGQSLYFAPLGGKTFTECTELLRENHLYDGRKTAPSPISMDRAVLYVGRGHVFHGIEAVLESFVLTRKSLKLPIRLIRLLTPTRLRSFLYDRFGAYRHRISKKDSCDIPPKTFVAKLLP